MNIIFRIIFLLLVLSSNLFAGIKEAKKAFAQRQYQKAIKLFTEYTKEDPSDGEPYMYMGYIYENEKDFPRSMVMFRRAVDLKLNPKHKKVTLIKILLYYNYQQSWDILAHYSNRLLKLDPNNREGNKMRDRALANSGRDPGSLGTVRLEDIKPKKKIITEEKEIPKENDNYKEVSISKKEQIEKKTEKTLEEKKWEACLEFLKKEDYQKADNLLKELLQIDPSNKNYLYKAGITKLRLGEFAKSIELFESAKKISDEVVDKQLLYYIYLNQGQAELKLGNSYPALFLFNKAYEYNPNTVPLIPIMRINYEKEDFIYTIKISEEILKKDSKNLEALMYKSLSLVNLGDRTKGYKNLLTFSKEFRKNKKNQISEKFHEGILFLGFFYTNRAKYKLASKYLTQVQKTKDKTKKYNFAMGKMNFYTKNYGEAKVFLEKVSDLSAASYLLSKIYSLNNDLPKTKEYLLKAASIRPIYWIKPKVDVYFKNFITDPQFISFIENKGLPPKTIEPIFAPSKEVTKTPTKDIEILPDKKVNEEVIEQPKND